MAEVTLTATTGRPLGSSASRRLRAEGKIPATVYGMDKDAVSVTITRSDLRKAMTTDAGVNALIKLEIDGAATEYALVKEIQRHTVRREVTHLDLLRIDPETAMVLDVPIVLTGDAKKVSGGGGFVDQKLSTLRVTVRPDSFMYVWGNARATRAAPMRSSATSACSLELRNFSRCRSASRSSTSTPTLWRVPRYLGPGLPRPTTRRSQGVLLCCLTLDAAPRERAPRRITTRIGC